MFDRTKFAEVPKLYAQDGMGNDAVVYAHFFGGSWDWYMTEYDPSSDMGFGLVHGFEDELGYFSIAEMEELSNTMPPKIEQDLYWEPTTLGVVRDGLSTTASSKTSSENRKSIMPNELVIGEAYINRSAYDYECEYGTVYYAGITTDKYGDIRYIFSEKPLPIGYDGIVDNWNIGGILYDDNDLRRGTICV